MRRLSLVGMVLFAIAATVALTVGCGKDNKNTNTPVVLGGTVSNGGCPAGTVSHPLYGCLQQGNCPSGSGLYFGQCIAIPSNGTGGSCPAGYVYSSYYGCLPQGYCPFGYGSYYGRCVPTDGGVNTCQGNCGSGYVRTNYGCLPQSSCPTCFGSLNGTCYPGI